MENYENSYLEDEDLGQSIPSQPAPPIVDEEELLAAQVAAEAAAAAQQRQPGGAFNNVGQGLIGTHRDMMMQYWQETINSIEHDDHDFKNHQLPLARIKKVMKTDEDVRMISAEAPILFAKGCDVFITELTMRAWIHAEENKRRTLQKSDIAAALTKSDMFDFLIDVVPRQEEKPKKSYPSRSNGYNTPRQSHQQQTQQLQQPQQQHQEQLINEQIEQQQQAPAFFPSLKQEEEESQRQTLPSQEGGGIDNSKQDTIIGSINDKTNDINNPNKGNQITSNNISDRKNNEININEDTTTNNNNNDNTDNNDSNSTSNNDQEILQQQILQQRLLQGQGQQMQQGVYQQQPLESSQLLRQPPQLPDQSIELQQQQEQQQPQSQSQPQAQAQQSNTDNEGNYSNYPNFNTVYDNGY